MIREKAYFPVVYMFAVTAFFSSVVIGLTRLTAGRVRANEKLAFEKAVLKVLPGLYDEREAASRLQLHRRFKSKVKEPGELSPAAYTLVREGNTVAYALPFSGRGFWAPIKGVIGIKADRRTITGIAFYQQNETPGLGAEITKQRFTDQFDGKVMSTGEKVLDIKPPAAALDRSSVHAVTGATQTSVRLERMINDALNKWRRRTNGAGQ